MKKHEKIAKENLLKRMRKKKERNTHIIDENEKRKKNNYLYFVF